jgi:C-terminal processing protease CtpA/Prc
MNSPRLAANRMNSRIAVKALLLCVAAFASHAAHAVEAKVGIAITVEGEGFFLNPIVSRIRVKEVEKASLAEAAGIVAGDEIIQIEGRPVAGRRALDLKPYLEFKPGETRSLRIKHENGDQFDARITKPKE